MKYIDTLTKRYFIAPYIVGKFRIQIEDSYVSAVKQGIIAGMLGVLLVMSVVILLLS
jgi:hypothetical protein